VLEWGNLRLTQSVKTDLLMIDELGPLEFERQMGWTASFDLLKSGQFGIAMVVIRPECLAAFSQMGFAYQIEEVGNS
jgi:nucleoside-triphosphatase THEP1